MAIVSRNPSSSASPRVGALSTDAGQRARTVTSASAVIAFDNAINDAAIDRTGSDVAALGAVRCARDRKGESAHPRTESPPTGHSRLRSSRARSRSTATDTSSGYRCVLTGDRQDRLAMRFRSRPAIGYRYGSGPGRRSATDAAPTGDRLPMRFPVPSATRRRRGSPASSPTSPKRIADSDSDPQTPAPSPDRCCP